MKCLSTVNINGKTYSIRATKHSMKRMEERNLDEYMVTGNILALGKERILKLQEENEEAIIIDEVKSFSIVIGFKGNTIHVITVIDKSNVFIKNNTQIINL